MTLIDGSATFTLKHGQSITIGEIPKDATYEVRETDSTGYTVVLNEDENADGIAEGTIVKGETSNAAFTNLKLSALSFTKGGCGGARHCAFGRAVPAVPA